METLKMTKLDILNSNQDVLKKLAESARRGELVVITGTGVSMSLTDCKFQQLSWNGLIKDGFTFGVSKGLILPNQQISWEPQLKSKDIDDLLCAAEFLSRKLNSPKSILYTHWIQNNLKDVGATNVDMKKAIIALNNAGIPICTLNYDLLLEQVLGLEGVVMSEASKVASWMRQGTKQILHLHGSCIYPETCILGIRDYETTIGNDIRDLIQRSLGSFKRLLFIGCGDTFLDPNFTALISWLKGTMKTAALEHYALVIDSEVEKCNSNLTWHGFIEPIGYGLSYNDLPLFLLNLFPDVKTIKRIQNNVSINYHEQSKAISSYLEFLIKDCGQMTIEGVRADMEIGQRKFDLERLFVPLEVIKCQPEISESDPQRDEKIRKWKEKNDKPLSFGKVLRKHKRIALLALPGGGKTLLLKRLAVAYADRNRLQKSNDLLPDFNLVPVLIRCREWREHIQCPIISIIKKLPEITGDFRLTGLADALIPLLKKGRVLLLIDGLDEIHNDAHRSTFVEHLESFLEDYNQTRLIITSREAGFSLVAPCISRFCERWNVAPLSEEAITALCSYWQTLMVGDSPQSQLEGHEVSQYLLKNDSLRRLAENPLLLTMLLVVKHGSGRLPPDRVSLYNRAVEVLLDTWNIKGHDSLNPKEAVPQLACVAFEMMRAGKQTATEKELLKLIENARENVPQIRRYAKDTPYDFLKRVELRSSLLVEAGHKLESGQTVPFYQFRHLTFQEYLAAVATVEGHYMEYKKNDTVLTPLEPYLTTDEWKEIIPMAAVLARKQAEPLFAALVAEGINLRDNDEAIFSVENRYKRIGSNLPAPVSRLVQCFAEEAEASPETLSNALQLITFFAYGCNSSENWEALCRGPYGDELLHQAWMLYSSMHLVEKTHILYTCSHLFYIKKPRDKWFNSEGESEFKKALRDSNQEENVKGIFAFIGYLMSDRSIESVNSSSEIDELSLDIVKFLARCESKYQLATVFALTIIWSRQPFSNKTAQSSFDVLNQILSIRLSATNIYLKEWCSIAISMHINLSRGSWKLELNDSETILIRESLGSKLVAQEEYIYYINLGDFMIAFHLGSKFTDAELYDNLKLLKKENTSRYNSERIDSLLNQLVNNKN